MKKHTKILALVLTVIMLLSSCSHTSPYGEGAVSGNKPLPKETTATEKTTKDTTEKKIETTRLPGLPDEVVSFGDYIYDPETKHDCRTDAVRVTVAYEKLDSEASFDPKKKYKVYTADDFADVECIKVEAEYEVGVFKIDGKIYAAGLYDLYFSDPTLDELKAKREILDARNDVISTVYVPLHSGLSAVPDDCNTFTEQQWAVQKIHLPGAWDIRTDVTVEIE